MELKARVEPDRRKEWNVILELQVVKYKGESSSELTISQRNPLMLDLNLEQGFVVTFRSDDKKDL